MAPSFDELTMSGAGGTRTMAAYGRSRQTRAAAETIWQLWSDLSTWQDWNPNVQRMEVNAPFVNGTTASCAHVQDNTTR